MTVDEVVAERVRAAVAGHVTFASRIEALLADVARLPASDAPAATVGNPIADAGVPEAVRSLWHPDSILADVVDAGIDSGQVSPEDRELMLAVLVAYIRGLLLLGSICPSSQAGESRE